MASRIRADRAQVELDGQRSTRFNETHQKILDAARHAFATHGYARANTAAIASAAGVTERTLFRHFATKPALFQEAAIAPFHHHIDSYVTRLREHTPSSLEPHVAARQFYSELFDLFERDRGLVIALASAREFEDPGGTQFPGLASELADQLSGLENVMSAEASARGYALDPAILARVMFGLALAVSVHGDWIFGPTAKPDRELLLDQLAAFTNHGMAGH
jgi:AcrR family transcriptional regulator